MSDLQREGLQQWPGLGDGALLSPSSARALSPLSSSPVGTFLFGESRRKEQGIYRKTNQVPI